MTTFEAATLVAIVCPLVAVALAAWAICAVAGKRDDNLPLFRDDPTPFEDDEPTDEILALDPPVDRAYIPPAGMVLYRGGAVHPECAERWLRYDLAPVDGCAVWLTDDLKASTT